MRKTRHWLAVPLLALMVLARGQYAFTSAYADWSLCFDDPTTLDLSDINGLIVTTGAEASISRIQTVTSWRSSLVRTEAEAGIHSRVLAKVAMRFPPPKFFPVSLHAASARFSMLSATPRVRRCR